VYNFLLLNAIDHFLFIKLLLEHFLRALGLYAIIYNLELYKTSLKANLMKIALLLKDDKIDESYMDTMPIIVLHTDSQSVVEVEKDLMVKKDINYLALWLLTKKIKEIYVMDIDPLIKKLFEKLGVIVRKYEDMDRNPLLKKFIS